MRIILSTPTGCFFFHWRVCWVCFVKVKSLKDFANIGWLQKVWSFFLPIAFYFGGQNCRTLCQNFKEGTEAVTPYAPWLYFEKWGKICLSLPLAGSWGDKVQRTIDWCLVGCVMVPKISSGLYSWLNLTKFKKVWPSTRSWLPVSSTNIGCLILRHSIGTLTSSQSPRKWRRWPVWDTNFSLGQVIDVFMACGRGA